MERPFARLFPLVETLAGVLHPYLDMPFAFFGHSMGALISFELARQLRRQSDLQPIHLFVAARRAPQLADTRQPIHGLAASGFVRKLRDLNGTPEAVLQNAELMELLLPMLRADFELCETYLYADEEPLDCPITAFGGQQDSEVSRDEIVAWRDQTRSSFAFQMLPGTHFFLWSAREFVLRGICRGLIQPDGEQAR